MNTKTVKKGNETGKWRDTGIYWRDKGNLFYFERSINTVMWCRESCFDGNQFNSSCFNLCGSYCPAIGEQGRYENEAEMMKGKALIDREEFVKQWNIQRIQLPTTFEP